MSGAEGVGNLELRHALLRVTDRAVGAEVSNERQERDLEALRAAVAEARGGLGRRDARLREDAERIRKLETDLEDTRRQLALSRAEHRQCADQLTALQSSRSFRIGQAIVRPAARVTKWAGR